MSKQKSYNFLFLLCFFDLSCDAVNKPEVQHLLLSIATSRYNTFPLKHNFWDQISLGCMSVKRFECLFQGPDMCQFKNQFSSYIQTIFYFIIKFWNKQIIISAMSPNMLLLLLAEGDVNHILLFILCVWVFRVLFRNKVLSKYY